MADRSVHCARPLQLPAAAADKLHPANSCPPPLVLCLRLCCSGDPFIGMLETPVTSSPAIAWYLSNLPAYRCASLLLPAFMGGSASSASAGPAMRGCRLEARLAGSWARDRGNTNSSI